MKSDDVTFPLPDRKYVNQKFFCNSIKRAQRMYNMLPSTTQKISLSTYCKYRPKNFKLQGKIPFHQSCCERSQNFDNVVGEINKFMLGVPRTLADCVDSSLCDYNTFFPSINCILRNCNRCGTKKLKDSLEKQQNIYRMKDCRKRFLVKQWENKSKMKNGDRQTYMHWKYLCLNYHGLLDLCMCGIAQNTQCSGCTMAAVLLFYSHF